jgi:hypothetical protein|tara:strand:- start:754 stop:924 length:171 start_codon:yes stop_codon:yes gene_type:complete
MKKYKKKPWSNEECKVILVNYNYVDKSKLVEWLPGRTATAITGKAWQLRKKGFIFK